ncbi:MAG: hypothetical protein A3F54_04325 [Candidatus Kerfeldbacteria bacterium RIFCSPHIGHO2_12_FULL_48_17]|uniref:DUF1761 domain-containing protein n=1 Tax=Candidatus Kerfeldbacteria bacterium RIFCSPHIGHO2_12_FULL_48_17 TaxID=1798542 RepID=A0A1G2B7G4_9BACT|nr:MAG: hypothetical protein A3F54_04325 [Candidatus Kerfeldbacteria bacterium RIFCSPHIGHO2_12_FULL_48_17]
MKGGEDMLDMEINYIAVLVTAIISMVLGGIWYSPMLFGKMWAKEMGWNGEEMKKRQKEGAMKGYIVMFIGALVMQYILAHFVQYTDADTFMLGATTGFWLWLGFIVTIMVPNIFWEGKSMRAVSINVLYQLINLLIAGGILAIWV